MSEYAISKLTDWCRLLRSGEYKQTKGKLRRIITMPEYTGDPNKYCAYCAFGLLALITPGGEEILEEYIALPVGLSSDYMLRYSMENLIGFHFNQFSELCQSRLNKSISYFENSAIEDFIIYLNDDAGFSFPQIADFVEEFVITYLKSLGD